MNMAKGYSEPADYFPKELRKKYKIGEYATKTTTKKATKKTATKRTTKRK